MDTASVARVSGSTETIQLVLDKGALSCDLLVELVDATEDDKGQLKLVEKTPLRLVDSQGSRCTYELNFVQSKPGHFKRALRTPSCPTVWTSRSYAG